jgi:hypothetical protein
MLRRTPFRCTPSSFLARHTLRWFATVAITVPTAADAQQPNLDGITQMLARLEQGNEAVRGRLETEARGLMRYLVSRTPKLDELRVAARVGLALGAPFAAPGAEMSDRERTWRPGVVRSLREILSRDSGDVAAASALERLAPYPQLWLPPEQQRTQLRALAARHDTLPVELALTLAALELECGDADAADAALSRLVGRHDAGPQVWHLGARISRVRGGINVESRYLAGAQQIAHASEFRSYRRDLEWLADSATLAGWDRVVGTGDAAADWLRRFWTALDIEDGRLPGTRLGEQFDRWQLALASYRWDPLARAVEGQSPGSRVVSQGDLHFPFPSMMTKDHPGYANRYSPISHVLDDRGVLVMRHGAPVEVQRFPGVLGDAQEMLVWVTASGRLLVSFSRPAGELREQLHFGMLARNFPVGDLVVGCQIEPRLCTLAAIVTQPPGATDGQVTANLVRDQFVAAREVAETTQGNPERMAHEMGAAARVYGLSGSQVVVAWQRPAPCAEAVQCSGSLMVRSVLGDRVKGVVAGVLDALVHGGGATGSSAPTSGLHLVSAQVGRWDAVTTILDSTASAGSGVRQASVHVPDAVSGRLDATDLMLGRAENGLALEYRGQRIMLNPAATWRAGEDASLWMEVFGLTPGERYRVEIILRDRDRDDTRSLLTLAEGLQASAGTLTLDQSISFRKIAPGEYRLEVTITSPSGEVVRREHPVVIGADAK